MFYLDWRFTLMALLVAPVLFAVVFRYTRRIKAASRAVRQKESELLSRVAEVLSSIRDNIAYGRPNASCRDVRRAAELADAHEFIESMPQGYDTIVGERGDTLSGGQRQRISIARAVIRNTPILLLDEPTANLDAASEQSVMAALGRLMKGRTSVFIAHHLAAIRHADRQRGDGRGTRDARGADGA